MSIADKLTAIAENVQKVYDAGYDAGKAEGGVESYYDTFWDAYQQNGNRTNYDRAFAGIGWTKDTFKPKYLPIRPTSSNMYMTFAYSQIGKIDESILDTSQMKNFSMTFYQWNGDISNPNLTDVTIDISSLMEMRDAFNYNSALETVVLKNVPETCNFTGGFRDCYRLTNFTVTGTIGGTTLDLSACSLLTDASVQCIIDHLKDRTGATAATLTFHKDVGAKLTEEQKATITAKNWTLVY